MFILYIYIYYVIYISDIIEYAKSLTDELGEEVKTKIDEERDKEAANLEEIESKKKKPKEIIKEEIKEFIPHDVLSKVIKRMLKENLYRNRGYILEGYPKSFSMAKNCFYEINEEPQENEPKEKLLDEIMPNSLVKLLCTKNQPLIDRFKVKSEEELKNTHYNEKDMNRRLATYRQENESTTGEFSCEEFFTQNGVEFEGVNATKEMDVIIDRAKVFVERVSNTMVVYI